MSKPPNPNPKSHVPAKDTVKLSHIFESFFKMSGNSVEIKDPQYKHNSTMLSDNSNADSMNSINCAQIHSQISSITQQSSHHQNSQYSITNSSNPPSHGIHSNITTPKMHKMNFVRPLDENTDPQHPNMKRNLLSELRQIKLNQRQLLSLWEGNQKRISEIESHLDKTLNFSFSPGGGRDSKVVLSQMISPTRSLNQANLDSTMSPSSRQHSKSPSMSAISKFSARQNILNSLQSPHSNHSVSNHPSVNDQGIHSTPNTTLPSTIHANNSTNQTITVNNSTIQQNQSTIQTIQPGNSSFPMNTTLPSTIHPNNQPSKVDFSNFIDQSESQVIHYLIRKIKALETRLKNVEDHPKSSKSRNQPTTPKTLPHDASTILMTSFESEPNVSILLGCEEDDLSFDEH